MSLPDGKMTGRELITKYGGTAIPPDDPIFKPGFTIGATVPYRQRPAGSTSEASSTAPTEAQTPQEGDMSDPKVAGRMQDRIDQFMIDEDRKAGLT
ncbi:MAG: hypothetical protein ABTS16_19475 [Candidatus Accumulibacter phosphatis]|jgi:hypothetical protein|uniref:Uncharacterized protein n=1 Tax=Candidatus Accumulibacter contiguus TaxID=2954381 RepID=A0ABX1TBR9_9PROT|nr:hypothetical protein [Candidatus Accumulibacter contiguus]NMQ07117.1 hypothetical protein [Candidatus Accumulibacter contiguus]